MFLDEEKNRVNCFSHDQDYYKIKHRVIRRSLPNTLKKGD